MNMALEELSDRIRTLLPTGVYAIEKRMFGGVAFMVHGNMLVCPFKNGSLMVRVGKEGMKDALARPGASVIEMKGRTMGGFVVVSGDAIEDDDELAAWLALSYAFVKTLPAK